MTDKKIATFLIRGDIDANSKDMSVVSELNEILRKMGSEISVEPTADENFSYLTIIFDTKKAHDFLSRGAGRKRKEPTSDYSIAEIRKMLEKEPAEEVAKKLGVSRATLFRRLRALKEEMEGENPTFTGEDEKYLSLNSI